MFVNALLNYPSYLFHQDQVEQLTASTTPHTPPREPLSEPTATPRGCAFKSHITGASRADYIVYVIKRNDCPVAVLIEAKHTIHQAIKHILPQVTGYFAAFDMLEITPLVLVLTEEHVQVIIYPIKDGEGTALINRVVLPPFPLFNNDGFPHWVWF